MSSSLTIARPYARAAFEYASAHQATAEWAGKLAFAAEASADPDAAALFGDPRIEPRTLASLFVAAGEPADSPFRHFVELLADNRRLRELPEIAALFEQLKRDAENVLKVRVRSAVPLDDAIATQLVAALKRRFSSDIELERSIDPSVLGGAVIDAGEQVIDGSLRSRLAKLESALTQ
ncbi:MAG TPA: F0F1 ATP synthase subunit delta [Rhodanobacteraceae bacterium]|jgi:F-type H+-transporting ATPase subunit delta|nr:F0F1 ATP synthase subunit delta [Rhodanobacteraceae bacterium]